MPQEERDDYPDAYEILTHPIDMRPSDCVLSFLVRDKVSIAKHVWSDYHDSEFVERLNPVQQLPILAFVGLLPDVKQQIDQQKQLDLLCPNVNVVHSYLDKYEPSHNENEVINNGGFISLLDVQQKTSEVFMELIPINVGDRLEHHPNHCKRKGIQSQKESPLSHHC